MMPAFPWKSARGLALLALLLITGCDQPVAKVKNGYLNDHKGTTVGMAFDKYEYFKTVEWHELETRNGQKVVEVFGELDLPKFTKHGIADMAQRNGIEKGVLHVQFLIHASDEGFDLGYVGLDTTKAGKTDSNKLDQLEIRRILESIYRNDEFA